MAGNMLGAKSFPAAQRAAVDFNATYSFAGTRARPTRVHGFSASGIRILTAEHLTLRRAIVVDVETARGLVRIPGKVFLLAGISGSFFSYEIRVDEEIVLATLGSVASHRRGEERRLSMRVAVDLPARYTHRARTFEAARIIEVSTSGLQLRAQEPILVRSMLEIEIRIDRRCSVISGQVVRIINEGDERFDYGVKIFNDPAVKDVLRGIVLSASVNLRR